MDLVVFLMRGMSLAHYERIGMFEREMALYRALRRHGVRTALVTYGGHEDLRFARRLPGIRILCNWPGWKREVYERRLVWLHAPWLARADIIKAEQTDGGEVAIWSARRWRKPVVARCGFLWAGFAERQYRMDSPQAREAERVSRMVFSQARHVVVTTPVMELEVMRRFGVSQERIVVIPNYVDTDLFRPEPSVVGDCNRVLAIGRLHPEKNHAALIEAVRGTTLQLLLVGCGADEMALRQRATELKADVQFLGNRPHNELPALIRSCGLFAQPSLIEGHPKTILEAMACGAAVLGADVPGIRETIRHGETGWLCGVSPEGIRRGLETLLGDAALRMRLGCNARRLVEERFALDQIVEQELNVYRRVLGTPAA